MGLFTKDIATLDDLFVHTLQDIYYAENQILKALPTMISKATDPQLKQGFQTHHGETQNQIRRLERVFQMHGQSPKGVTCPAIDGIIKEANEIAGEVADKDVLDAALLASAQAVEHYEITRYGTLIAWAQQLGRNDCASVLRQNLNEEKATDRKLTAIAESKVNPDANAHRGTSRQGYAGSYGSYGGQRRGRSYPRHEQHESHGWTEAVGPNTYLTLAVLGGLTALTGWLYARSGEQEYSYRRSQGSGSYRGGSNQHDIAALEALTSTLTDSINGYEEAAEVASNAGISAFLREKARERRAVTSDFRNRIATLGGDPTVSGSMTAALHRRFLDLRSMFQNDTKAAVAEVERGEGYLTERFETFIADGNLSPATRDLLRSTWQRVRFDHARWDGLKQALNA